MVENSNDDTEGGRDTRDTTDTLVLRNKVSSAKKNKDKGEGKDSVKLEARKAKSLVFAVLVSVLPGLGHFYLRYPTMGIIFSIWLFLSVLAGFLVLTTSIAGEYIAYAFILIFASWFIGYVLCVSDVFRICILKKSPDDAPRNSYWQWYGFFAVSMVSFILYMSLSNFWIARAGDESMRPLIGKGDYYLYLMESDSSNLSRGDIAVFNNPLTNSGEEVRVLRVMAKEREQIKLENEVVYVNGKPLLRARYPDSDRLSSSDNAVRYLEKFTLGSRIISYVVLELSNLAAYDTTRTYFVPPDKMFLMGDNRDNSLDSRMANELGFVSSESYVGQPQFVLFSSDSGRMGKNLKN